MQVDQEIERFIQANNFNAEKAKKARTYLPRSLPKLGENPSQADLDVYEAQISTERIPPGRVNAGKPYSAKARGDWMSITTEFYEWSKTQKGDASQLTIQFESEDELSAVEPQVPAETASSEITETLEPEESTESTASDQPVESLESEPPVRAPRRGRKPKPEAEKLIAKFSVYLTEESAEAMRDLAVITKQEVSVLFSRLAESFIARNSEKLSEYRRHIPKPDSIEF